MTLSPSLVLSRVGCLLTLACLCVYGGCREMAPRSRGHLQAGCGVTGGAWEGGCCSPGIASLWVRGCWAQAVLGDLKGLWGLDVTLSFTPILSAPQPASL